MQHRLVEQSLERKQSLVTPSKFCKEKLQLQSKEW